MSVDPGDAPADVTDLLLRWTDGDRAALDSLMPLVYVEMRKTASALLRRERSDHTLQATALVHETWLRMVRQDRVSFEHRKQFFGLAAQVMRRILVDHARATVADKRGGGAVHVPLQDSAAMALGRPEELLALDRALATLARADARRAQVIELRYFGGLTIDELAEVLGVSAATVSRDQRAAEAWLVQAMSTPGPPASGA